MYVVLHSNFAAFIVCQRYKPCGFPGFVWTDCWGNKSCYVITSTANRLEYQNQRFLVKDMIKKAKIDYYSSQVNESAGDQKKLFKVIDNLLHKSKIPVLPSSDSDELLAIEFSEFFHQKIENIRKTFNTSCSNISPHVTLNSPHLQTPKLCSFIPANVEEIKKSS